MVLNSVPLRPSRMTMRVRRIGEAFTAANGRRRFAHRAFKREWELEWSMIDATTRSTLLALATTAGTMTLTTSDGSFTVMIAEDGFNSSVAFIDRSGNLWYDATLTLIEV